MIKIQITALALAITFITVSCSKQSEPKTNPPKPESEPKAVTGESKPPPGIDVYSSFDADNNYDKKTAWVVMNGQSGYRGQAEWFVPDVSGPLNFVELAMRGTGSVNITVAEDKNGVPGNPIESFLNIASSRFGRDGILVLISSNHPVVSAGTKYWLCAEPSDIGTGCSWGYNNQNFSRGFAFEREQGNWSFVQGGPCNGAFRINVVK
jgi:hypothetical protein